MTNLSIQCVQILHELIHTFEERLEDVEVCISVADRSHLDGLYKLLDELRILSILYEEPCPCRPFWDPNCDSSDE